MQIIVISFSYQYPFFCVYRDKVQQRNSQIEILSFGYKKNSKMTNIIILKILGIVKILSMIIYTW